MVRRSPFAPETNPETIMDTEQIRHVAWLARIAADDEELDAYRAHFDRLLDFRSTC